MFQAQEKVLAGDYRDVKNTAGAVVAVATVAMVLVDLTKLTIEARSIMKMSDEAARAKRAAQLGWEQLRNRLALGTSSPNYFIARDLGAIVVKESRSDSASPVWLAAKSVASAWCDMTSPSFWASTYVNLANGKSWSEAVSTNANKAA